MMSCVHACSVMSDSATSWTVARQAPLSMEISRQEYWSGLPFPTPGDLSNSGIRTGSPTLQVDSLLLVPPGKPSVYLYHIFIHSSVDGHLGCMYTLLY